MWRLVRFTDVILVEWNWVTNKKSTKALDNRKTYSLQSNTNEEVEEFLQYVVKKVLVTFSTA